MPRDSGYICNSSTQGHEDHVKITNAVTVLRFGSSIIVQVCNSVGSIILYD